MVITYVKCLTNSRKSRIIKFFFSPFLFSLSSSQSYCFLPHRLLLQPTTSLNLPWPCWLFRWLYDWTHSILHLSYLVEEWSTLSSPDSLSSQCLPSVVLNFGCTPGHLRRVSNIPYMGGPCRTCNSGGLRWGSDFSVSTKMHRQDRQRLP